MSEIEPVFIVMWSSTKSLRSRSKPSSAVDDVKSSPVIMHHHRGPPILIDLLQVPIPGNVLHAIMTKSHYNGLIAGPQKSIITRLDGM